MPEPLVRQLGYRFGDASLLRQALTHRSFGTPHNERLEFVGDAVLDCAVAAVLFERFPGIPEGDLTRVRASLVDERTLARLARELRIADEMRLGEGMRRSSVDGVIADALEAVFGAVFVDAGFDAARMAVEHVYATEFAHIDPGALAKDPKTRLQEWLQARKLAVPDYTVTATSGEAHAQTMVVECRIPALGIVTTGTGPRRQSAEQVAAAEALERIAAQSGEARNG